MTPARLFSATDITALVRVGDLVDPIRRAMIAVSQGQACLPPRFAMPVNDLGRMGLMYGALSDPPVHGAKVLSLFPGAADIGLSSHQGFFLLFDSRDGRPLGLFDADALTALRTAAMSILATRTFARSGARVHLICGAGEQAYWHLRGTLECLGPSEIRLWARNAARAGALRDRVAAQADRVRVVRDLPEALSGADVVHTTTSARGAYLEGDWLEPGQHLNLVGASLADSREIDDRAVARVAMFTDSLDSSARESGEMIAARQSGAIPADYPVVEIGAVLTTPGRGRTGATQITAYKSHGLIVQDLAAARVVLDRATSR